MLRDDVRDRSHERRQPIEQEPQRATQRVKIARMSGARPSNCSGLANSGVPEKPGAPMPPASGSRQPEIDDLHHRPVLILRPEQRRYSRLEIAMDEPLARGRGERAGHLNRHARGHARAQRPAAPHHGFQRLAVDQLHRTKDLPAIGSEKEDRRHIAMPQPRRGAGLLDEAFMRHRVAHAVGPHDLERHGAVEIDVMRPVSDAHRPAADFPEGAIRVAIDAKVPVDNFVSVHVP